MVTLRWGLQSSNNWVSAFLIDNLGATNFRDLLKEYGFNNPNIYASPALCLGPCENTVAEMVSAYTTFVNRGYRSAPIYVTKIVDSDGKEYGPDKLSRAGNDVINTETAEKMIVLLRGVVDGGTGSSLRSTYGIRAQMGGKTGTTNSNSDGWFMGITPKLVSGAWVGFEDRDIHFETMAYAQGSKSALPIFALFMRKVYADPSLGISENDVFSLSGKDPCQDDLGPVGSLSNVSDDDDDDDSGD